jgi:ribokinase
MQRIFVVGDINLDILCRIKRIAEKGREAHIDEINFSVGGNAANFSVALGKLGLKPEFISAIGNDFATPYLFNELKKSKVKTNLMKLDRANGFSIILVNRYGEKRMMSYKGATTELSIKHVMDGLKQVKQGDLLYVAGYCYMKNHYKFPQVLRQINH